MKQDCIKEFKCAIQYAASLENASDPSFCILRADSTRGKRFVRFGEISQEKIGSLKYLHHTGLLGEFGTTGYLFLRGALSSMERFI